MRNHPRSARYFPKLVALAAFVLCLCAPGAPAQQTPAQPAAGGAPAAVIGNETIYEKDFMPQLEGKLYKIEQQAYQLKRQALEDIINRKLLKAEAAKRGISEEALLKREADSKIPEPSDAEVEQEFVERMFQSGGQITASQDEVREQMKQDMAQQARADYFETLRQKAGVKIYLLPPALEVAYDPARVFGSADAKVTIVEFSDYQCPYCEKAYFMLKDLFKKYGSKIKLAYRDLPLIDQQAGSKVAGGAEASRCAGEQGKFWEYHDALFEDQDAYGESAFERFADDLGLDAGKFAACLSSGKFKNDIQKDSKEAIRLGATGTPAFFINGIFINGARPQNEFEDIIDALLAHQG
jgi:protein-disulfide isomerase